MRKGCNESVKHWLLIFAAIMAFSLPAWGCQAMTPQHEYIESIAPYAKKVKDYGLFPSVAIAQSCRETGYGRHLDSEDVLGNPIRQYNNVLGKKWRYGEYFEKLTPEGSGASRVMVVRKFQVYHSLKECFEDYGRNITKNPAYRGRDTSSPEAFIRSIARFYATDNPDAYANGVMRIIEKYDLTRFDK